MSMIQTDIERLNAEATPWWIRAICFLVTAHLFVASIVCIVQLLRGK